MENKELKELIVQKKESYDNIIDNTKKANVDKTVIAGVSLAALLAGVGGLTGGITMGFQFVASLVAAGVGCYGTVMYTPDFIKNLVVRFKARLAKRRLNKTLKTIESLEKEKTR